MDWEKVKWHSNTIIRTVRTVRTWVRVVRGVRIKQQSNERTPVYIRAIQRPKQPLPPLRLGWQSWIKHFRFTLIPKTGDHITPSALADATVKVIVDTITPRNNIFKIIIYHLQVQPYHIPN